ncbi:MAG: hypothetical protein R3D68_03205 [Hyphomicrobiaceae bacterium]
MLTDIMCLRLGLAILGGGLGVTLADGLGRGPLASALAFTGGGLVVAVVGSRVVSRYVCKTP